MLTEKSSAQSSTCVQCIQFCSGICKLRAIADWGDSAKVKPTRPACHFAELCPF
jgi:hypothetical protein